MNPSSKIRIAPAESAVFRSVAPAVERRYLQDEAAAVRQLCKRARLDRGATAAVLRDARALTAAMRESTAGQGGVDSFMLEYDLSSREGVVLMCLAESLLRIPDADTADRLIADKLGEANFHEHLGRSDDLLVNVGTWGLILSGRLLAEDAPGSSSLESIWKRMLARLGEPLIRNGLRTAMRIMSEHFVMGETIEHALDRAADDGRYRYSFDMLGEAAMTRADADDYLEHYCHAVEAIAQSDNAGTGDDTLSISIKLSALCPRFEFTQSDALSDTLMPRLNSLVELALECGVAITIDAEEADRLEPTLRVFESLHHAFAPKTNSRLGIAVQAYQKRGIAVVEWLGELARKFDERIPVRLVKGAYWDTEIKLAQVRGLDGFPVFTRKTNTDVSYLACARTLFDASGYIYPQFATHNPHTVAWILHQGADADFEFQRLHGMGEELYESLGAALGANQPCRVYAPVGPHRDLLPYLVRRLLENGANTSFVNRFVHAEIDVEELIQDPVAAAGARPGDAPNPRISLPAALFGKARRNSFGLNLADPAAIRAFAAQLDSAGGAKISGDPATPETMRCALDAATAAFREWDATPAAERAQRLRRAADLFERSRAELVADCVGEGGRTVADALAEVREAVDFLRYYANECERLFGAGREMAGPTGERNILRMRGRGVFVCISPWNFPIAIFTGQVAAALAAGNTVIAKPAEQTSLTAARVVRLLIEGGVPADALQFLPASGRVVGETLLPDPRVAGVAFTGSTETAKTIERTLAGRDGPIAALIAETGGINAMIVDSSALLEQVVRDATTSAFNSAGQRCSALRLLCLQEDVADDAIAMLIGRMRELVIGDPARIDTDVGPVIDADAAASLQRYIDENEARVLFRCPMGQQHGDGHFVPPTLIELTAASDLTREVFGPILHVVRFDANALDDLIDELNAIGYGLTLGVQSRISSFARQIEKRARVGNIYVNRDMIGAVVGVQPFGGMGLSGTGPKAGGPHYLQRFGVEQAISINTAAVGGNIELLVSGSLPED